MKIEREEGKRNGKCFRKKSKRRKRLRFGANRAVREQGQREHTKDRKMALIGR